MRQASKRVPESAERVPHNEQRDGALVTCPAVKRRRKEIGAGTDGADHARELSSLLGGEGGAAPAVFVRPCIWLPTRPRSAPRGRPSADCLLVGFALVRVLFLCAKQLFFLTEHAGWREWVK
jgi:hypothetical protein